MQMIGIFAEMDQLGILFQFESIGPNRNKSKWKYKGLTLKYVFIIFNGL